MLGYGSYISLYTLKGRDTLPTFNIFEKIILEGIRKFIVMNCYFFILMSISVIRLSYFEDNLLISVFLRIIFVLIYVMVILGLMNRYLHQGSIIQTFNIMGMYRILTNIKIKNFILVLICVFIAQLIIGSSVFDFSLGFTLLELIHIIFSFFVSPALLIFTKRLTALHIRELFADSIYNYRLN